MDGTYAQKSNAIEIRQDLYLSRRNCTKLTKRKTTVIGLVYTDHNPQLSENFLSKAANVESWIVENHAKRRQLFRVMAAIETAVVAISLAVHCCRRSEITFGASTRCAGKAPDLVHYNSK